MNFIIYELKVRGIKPSTIKLKYGQGIVDDIIINISDLQDQLESKMEIRFNLLPEIDDVDQAIKETCEIAKNIVNLMFLKAKNVSFGVPKFKFCEINGKHKARGEITLYNLITVDLPKNISKELEQSLIDNSLLTKLKNDPYQRLYRAAMRTVDQLGKFMLLYGILYDLLKSQKKIDELIKREEPGVEERASTRKGKDNETIYTWLRNQIGHPQKDTNLSKVEIEISRVCDKLAYIVNNVINKGIV
jgi:hypothetical protein